MKFLAVVALVCSVALNVWLYGQYRNSSAPIVSVSKPAAVNSPATVAKPGADESRPAAAPNPKPTEATLATDLSTTVARLRAAGFAEDLVRVLGRSILEERYAAQRREYVLSLPFWKEHFTPEMIAALKDLRTQNREALIALFGPGADSGNLTPEQARHQYGSIAQEKIGTLAALIEDYEELRANVMQQPNLTAADRSSQLEMLSHERAADLAKLLTTEELEAYESRNSAAATKVATAVDNLAISEEQYLSLFRLQSQFEKQTGPAMSPEGALAQLALFSGAQAVLDQRQFAQYLNNSDELFGLIRPTTDRLGMDPMRAFDIAQIQRRIGAKQLTTTEGAKQIVQILGPQGVDAYIKTDLGSWITRFLPPRS